MLFKIRYLQLGKYRTTMVGHIESWSDMGIIFINQDKRHHSLQPKHILKIEPLYMPKAQEREEAADEQDQPQLDLFNHLASESIK